MKITKIEKIVMALILLISVFMVKACIDLSETIDKSGGIKVLIIEAGKDINDISKKIEAAE